MVHFTDTFVSRKKNLNGGQAEQNECILLHKFLHLKYKMYRKRQLPLSDLMERMVTCMEEYFERQEGQVQGWFGVQAQNVVFGISSSLLWTSTCFTLALSKNTTLTLLPLIAKLKRRYVSWSSLLTLTYCLQTNTMARKNPRPSRARNYTRSTSSLTLSIIDMRLRNWGRTNQLPQRTSSRLLSLTHSFRCLTDWLLLVGHQANGFHDSDIN